MLNPLIHTSNSAPTSPMVTRSIKIQQQPSASGPHHHHHPATSHSLATNAIVAAVVSRRPRMRDNSPNGGSQSNSRRRLSRVVKCRTLDFTEFPEGMREYAFYAHAANNNNGPAGAASKMQVRESRSQPGSPVSIPKIQVQDFGDVLNKFWNGGSEVSRVTPAGRNSC